MSNTVQFDIIVAMDRNHGIGKNNDLPWHLPADLKRFKELTCQTINPQAQNAVIMGRKTWQSLPDRFRPLPNRLNIVLTSQAEFEVPDGVLKFSSWDSLINEYPSLIDRFRLEQTFVIGGARVFDEVFHRKLCRRCYITEIDDDFDCDVHFPPFPANVHPHISGEWQMDNDISYRFVEYSSKF